MPHPRRSSRRVLLLVAMWSLAAMLASALACHDLEYDRTANFCCLEIDRCREARAPGIVECPADQTCNTALNECFDTVAECTTSAECPNADLPACVDGRCVACDADHACPASAPVCSAESACEGCTEEAACSGLETTPHCGPTGACVACRPDTASDCATATAPICDTASYSCRACREGDCGTGLCGPDGACIAETEVAWVAKTGQDSGTCTQQAPCLTIGRALGQLGSRSWIHVAASGEPYAEASATPGAAVQISGKSVTILGQGAALTTMRNGDAAIVIEGSSEVAITGLRIADAGGATGDGIVCRNLGLATPQVTLRDVEVAGNGGVGVKATTCVLRVDQSTIARNNGGGIQATSSTVTTERSTVTGNTSGGISITGGSATLVNNFIVRNGGLSSPIGGVELRNLTGLTFDFNTVAGNGTSAAGFAAGVQCSATTPVTLSNSIVHGDAANQVSGADMNCAFAYNLSNESLGGTNVATAAAADSLFVNPTEGDYHTKAGSPAIAAGQPGTTIAVDFDGDARPSPAGSRADIGADEVTP
jgi:hypothetical protein